ncbi:MAG: DUF3048 domain-containing protein [Candidatus Dormibacteraeota bacterium]|nr:DUF3048 domain-containing protein [Candidatus Dormibacteraeota bacterium]
MKNLINRATTVLAVFVLSLLITACGQAPADSSIKVSIEKPKVGYVRLSEPVLVNFNHKISPTDVSVTIDPATAIDVNLQASKLTLKPIKGWRAGQIYAVALKNLRSPGSSAKLQSWSGSFRTQPRIGVAGYLVDGQPVTGTPQLKPQAKVAIAFTAPMNPDTVGPLRNGAPSAVNWAPDFKSATFAGVIEPYQTYKFSIVGIGGPPKTARGDSATDLDDFNATGINVLPSNATSEIPAGFTTQTPLLVVIDNAGQARPQHGLQQADMVYEYISEYGISRFTMIYFNHPASLMGPVRSCRMINAFLLSAFHGIQMCSGASVGTLHHLFGDANLPLLAVSINDFDRGNHYYRVGFKAAPHNVFTDRDRAERLRGEMKYGTSSQYVIDTPHEDNGLGTAADPPTVGLHGVRYSYDGDCQCYRPFDQGSPRVDANLNGAQLAVKNVLLMHVPFHDAGWVEDDNGGARSIQYEMNGSGPADLWSDGKLIHATWHQGTAGQNYFQNDGQPLYLTDEAGNYVRLNTGLTWVHAIGNGQ